MAGRTRPRRRAHPDAPGRTDTLPPDRPIYCTCRSGNRSGRVAEMLAASRVDAYNVVGGMVAWQRAGLPVVT
jgi:rhodanese-related sulfurtransferase